MSGKRGRFSYAAEPEVRAETAQPEQVSTDDAPSLSQKPGGAAHALQHPDAYALPPSRKGRPGEGIGRMDVPREQLNVRVRPELKRAAAALAGLQGRTLGDVVEAALIDYIRQSREGEQG